MGIGDLFIIGDRWKKAGLLGKAAYVFLAMVAIIILVIEVISRLQPVIDFNEKYNVTQRIVTTMNMPVMTILDAAALIFAVLIALVIIAAIVVLIIGVEEARVYTANSNARANAQQDIQKERDRANKLQQALDSLNVAYRKKIGVSEGSAIQRMDMKTVKEGSQEHLQSMSQDDLYQSALRLAREAGIELPS